MVTTRFSFQKYRAGPRARPDIWYLKSELQTQLSRTAAAGTNHGIGGGNVGRRTTTAKRARRGIVVRETILSSKGVGKIGMIEDVEELSPELRTQTFAELPVLGQRAIHVAESGVPENVAAHGAERAGRGR